MNQSVEYLDFLANHFSPRDWDYTREHQIQSIRYKPEYDPYNKLGKRVKNAFEWLFNRKPELFKELSLRMRFRMFKYALKRETHLPDGSLNSGTVLTFWEEDGEYIQMVQPSVGALLANFLKEEPEHPHAKIIIAELGRICNAYGERIKNGKVN